MASVSFESVRSDILCIRGPEHHGKHVADAMFARYSHVHEPSITGERFGRRNTAVIHAASTLRTIHLELDYSQTYKPFKTGTVKFVVGKTEIHTHRLDGNDRNAFVIWRGRHKDVVNLSIVFEEDPTVEIPAEVTAITRKYPVTVTHLSLAFEDEFKNKVADGVAALAGLSALMPRIITHTKLELDRRDEELKAKLAREKVGAAKRVVAAAAAAATTTATTTTTANPLTAAAATTMT